MEKRKIIINLFSKVSVQYENQNLNLSENQGKLLVSFFQLLAFHQDDPLSRASFVAAFWEDNDNPNNALNYTVYRLRSLLNKLTNEQMLITKQNCYMMNPDFEYEIDAVNFYNYYKVLKDEEVNVDNYDLIEDMLDIYSGDFYDNKLKSWTLQTSTQFKHIYEEFVVKLCNYYLANKNYEKVLHIVKRAIYIHEDNKEAYYLYLQALIALQRYDDVRDCYQKAKLLLKKDDEGIVSKRFRQLYNRAHTNAHYKLSLYELQSNLSCDKDAKSFYCNYEIFEYIYNFISREIARSKNHFYLIMFNLNGVKDKSLIVKYGEKLKFILLGTLRSNDVFTQINNEQYLALVECEFEEGAYVVAQRVLQKFQKSAGEKHIVMNYYVEGAKQKEG